MFENENKRNKRRCSLESLKGYVPCDQGGHAARAKVVFAHVKLSHIDKGGCKGQRHGDEEEKKEKEEKKKANQFCQATR